MCWKSFVERVLSGSLVLKNFFPFMHIKSICILGSKRNMQNSGGSFRSRLGSYADVLRTVIMQQIIDSGGSLNGLELGEIEVCTQLIVEEVDCILT